MKRIGVALMVALLAGCGDPTSIAHEDLLGSWVDTQSLSPRGTMDRTLTFGGDGRFVFRVDHYGVYPDQDAGDLSAWTEIRGAFDVEEDRLFFEPRTNTWWDSFYDDPGPFTDETDGALLDDATFGIQGDELVIRYVTYPLDAPVETTMRLDRLTP